MTAETSFTACMKNWLNKNFSVRNSFYIIFVLLLSLNRYIRIIIEEPFIDDRLLKVRIFFEKVPQLSLIFYQCLFL